VTAHPIVFARPAEAGGFEILNRLSRDGWSISVTPEGDGVCIRASRQGSSTAVFCRSVAHGALPLMEALRRGARCG